MFSALASLLLLGAVPPTHAAAVRKELPGIEVIHVTAPTLIASGLQIPSKLSASGVILFDLQSGEELFSRNADQRRPMASLTKIMTALLILEHHELTETVTVSAGAEKIRGSTIGVKAGEQFSVGALLKGMLIPSANDVAYTLAIFDAHSVGAFVQQMNLRATTLGLKNTHFTNPAGLDGEMLYSTPRDLGWLTMAALKNQNFRSIVKTHSAKIADSEGKEFDLRNTNELLQDNDNVFGVKTGTTNGAGECLIVLFEEQSHPYLLVLLGSKDRYTDSLYVLQGVHDAVVQ